MKLYDVWIDADGFLGTFDLEAPSADEALAAAAKLVRERWGDYLRSQGRVPLVRVQRWKDGELVDVRSRVLRLD